MPETVICIMCRPTLSEGKKLLITVLHSQTGRPHNKQAIIKRHDVPHLRGYICLYTSKVTDTGDDPTGTSDEVY